MKPNRISGVEHLSTYFKVYKVGDIIDIKVNFVMISVCFEAYILSGLVRHTDSLQ